MFVIVCETRPLLVYPMVFWLQKQRMTFYSSSCALVTVGVVNQATCVCVKSEEERPGEKNPLQYLEFALQYLVQPLRVN